MKFIAFSGKKEAGKTTAVNDLAKRLIADDRKVNRVDFADELKNIIRTCFGATEEQLYGSNADKETKLTCGKTARQLMQIIGTDCFRALDPDCWCRVLPLSDINAKAVRQMRGYFLCGDVRFPNEVKFIQDHYGGKVIRLTRCLVLYGHESETALDDYDGFDAVVDNREMSIAQQNEYIWELLNEKGWL
jgi:hypothetical protein